MRGVPDVASDAYQVGGMALVFVDGGAASTLSPSGTSGATPLWAGLVAMADQYAKHDLGFINPAIYSIARSSSYHKAFHDITTGNNGYPATPGMGPTDGLGDPPTPGSSSRYWTASPIPAPEAEHRSAGASIGLPPLQTTLFDLMFLVGDGFLVCSQRRGAARSSGG